MSKEIDEIADKASVLIESGFNLYYITRELGFGDEYTKFIDRLRRNGYRDLVARLQETVRKPAAPLTNPEMRRIISHEEYHTAWGARM